MAGSAAAIAGRYGELDMPVVIMAAKRDAIIDFARQAQRLAQAVAGAVLIAIDDAGHMLHRLVPDEVIEAVDLAAAAGPAKADNHRLHWETAGSCAHHTGGARCRASGRDSVIIPNTRPPGCSKERWINFRAAG